VTIFFAAADFKSGPSHAPASTLTLKIPALAALAPVVFVDDGAHGGFQPAGGRDQQVDVVLVAGFPDCVVPEGQQRPLDLAVLRLLERDNEASTP